MKFVFYSKINAFLSFYQKDSFSENVFVLFLFFSVKYFIVDAITVVLIFPSLSPSTQPAPIPTVNPHIVVHVHGTCICVLCLIASPPFNHSQPHYSLLQLSIYSLLLCPDSILFFSLFCSLASSYKWDHMVYVFLWLAYFT